MRFAHGFVTWASTNAFRMDVANGDWIALCRDECCSVGVRLNPPPAIDCATRTAKTCSGNVEHGCVCVQ